MSTVREEDKLEADDDDPDHMIKKKIIKKKGATQSFNTVLRNDPILHQKYFGRQFAPDPTKYKPDIDRIKHKYHSNVKLIPIEQAHQPREST